MKYKYTGTEEQLIEAGFGFISFGEEILFTWKLLLFFSFKTKEITKRLLIKDIELLNELENKLQDLIEKGLVEVSNDSLGD